MENTFNKKLKYVKKIRIIYIIFFLFLIINCLTKKSYFFIIKNFISEIEYQIKYSKIEHFLNICNSFIFINNKIYKNLVNPKISIISPIFNRERYIIRFLNSIRCQKFKDIEIILIDDHSTDNSVKIIKELIKIDKRIYLLKNKNKKGTFICRNIGSLFSKGKYLILPDPDDILSRNILHICYKFAEKYFYEMIKFHLYLGNKMIHFEKYSKTHSNIEINQPDLSMHTFYGNNELEIIDSNVSNKFIKKELYLRALNIINNFYLNKYIIYMEDSMMNFILHKTSKSLYFIKIIGYYYIKHSQSITNNEFNISKLRIKFCFIYLKLLLEYSKNVKYEKDIINIIFNRLNKKFKVQKLFSFNNLDLNFYDNIIKIFLNSKFISLENKKIFQEIKNKMVLINLKNKKIKK